MSNGLTVKDLRELIEGLDGDTRVVIKQWDIGEVHKQYEVSTARVTVARVDKEGRVIPDISARKPYQTTEITVLEIWDL
jgi:hypothetical protein